MPTGKILNINPESNIIVENLKASHWEYHGPTLFFETEKPRFEAVISLNKILRLSIIVLKNEFGIK